MKRSHSLWALLVVCVLFAGCTFIALTHVLQRTTSSDLTRAQLSAQGASVALLVVVLLLIGLVINETAFLLRRKMTRNGFVATRIAWLVGLLASSTSASSAPAVATNSVVSPIASTVSPAVAVFLLTHIEQRRREQILARTIPDVLTPQELQQLHVVRKLALRASHPCVASSTTELERLNPELMAAVDRAAVKTELIEDTVVEPQWIVEVKVFGYPMVVSVNGEVAEFRKKRALELLTWLSLNRDRARRSAARTAMWDIDISDSAFATVVSDMRRGLRELNTSHDAMQWLPATYSDDLPLSHLVVTDAERLNIAFRKFKSSSGNDRDELQDVLRGIRDVPFAGTSYAWADLDGTTTRLVITAVDICTEVAEVAAENEDRELFLLAVNAGLRVLPGCEELLELQSQHLERSFARRVAK